MQGTGTCTIRLFYRVRHAVLLPPRMFPYVSLTSSSTSSDDGILSEDINKNLVSKSASCFRQGIEHFESLKDNVNMSLLHSNIGRLMRLCANSVVHYTDVASRRREFGQLERRYFLKVRFKVITKM